MILLAIGIVLVTAGILSIRFPELSDSLKQHDHQQWQILYSTKRLPLSLGVYNWVLNHGYEQSASGDVISTGKKALHQAQLAQHLIHVGIALSIIGFIVVWF